MRRLRRVARASHCGRCCPAGRRWWRRAVTAGRCVPPSSAYKERGRRDLAGPLAALLAGPLAQAAACGPASRETWLVPAPSRPAAARARGRRPRAPAVPAPVPRRSPAARRTRTAAGQAGARLGRAGRRGTRGEPRGAAPGRRPGVASGGRGGAPRRRRRDHRRDAAGLPRRPRPCRSCRYGGDRARRCDHPESLKKYPSRSAKKLRTVALAPIRVTRTSDLLPDCDERYGRRAPSGTRSGLSGGTPTVAPKSSRRRVRPPMPRERARSTSGDCHHRPERRGPGSLPGARRPRRSSGWSGTTTRSSGWRSSSSTNATAASSRTASAWRSPAAVAAP